MRRRTLAAIAATTIAALTGSTAPAEAGRIYGGQPTSFEDPSHLVLGLSDDGTGLETVVVHLDLRCSAGARLPRRYPISLSLRNLGAIPGALPRRTYVLAAGPVQEDRVSAEIRGNTFLTATNGAAVGGSFRAEISATATGSRLSGTVRARQDLRVIRTGRRLGACALTDGWHADRRPGLLFAGHSSQNEPVVFELSRDRTRIDHGHVGWYASCRPSGSYWEPHEEFGLTSFLLRARPALRRRLPVRRRQAGLRLPALGPGRAGEHVGPPAGRRPRARAEAVAMHRRHDHLVGADRLAARHDRNLAAGTDRRRRDRRELDLAVHRGAGDVVARGRRLPRVQPGAGRRDVRGDGGDRRADLLRLACCSTSSVTPWWHGERAW